MAYTKIFKCCTGLIGVVVEITGTEGQDNIIKTVNEQMSAYSNWMTRCEVSKYTGISDSVRLLSD